MRSGPADLVTSAAELFDAWLVPRRGWFLVDAAALHMLGFTIDDDKWADHLNIYVDERVLPWKTSETEETVPPIDSRELQQYLRLLSSGVALHIVPAYRYIKRGIPVTSTTLSAGSEVQIITLEGYLRLGVMRGVEFLELWRTEGPNELIEIATVRAQRASQLAGRLPTDELNECLTRLQAAYCCVGGADYVGAVASFQKAAAILKLPFPAR